MFNGSLKQKLNFTHRRMKTTLQSFDRTSTKKILQKSQRPQQIFERAKYAYQNQNFMQTVLQLQEYLQYKFLDNQALYLCAVSYLHLNQPLQAIQKLQKITNSYSNKQQSCLLLAMAYSKVQNSQKSLQVINQCLQKYTRFEEGYCYRGKLYLKFEQFKSAQRDFFFSLKLNPNSFISRVGLGDCYYQQRKYELALKFYEESLYYIDKTCLSNISDINMKKGVCYFELQRWNDSINSFQKLSNKQFNSESYYYLGVSYLKVNRKHQGILNLEYCIKLQAKDTLILIQKAFKILIELYLNDFQFYQAINVLKLAESLNSQISCKYWQDFVEGCMLIIKSYFTDGVNKLNTIYDLFKKKNKPSIKQEKKDQFENQFLYLSHKPLKQKQSKKIVYNSKWRKSFSLKHVRKASFNQQTRNKPLFKSIDQKKPFAKLITSQGRESKLKTFFKSVRKVIPKKIEKQLFTEDEVIFIMPILLKFKAYGQFFMNNYLRSLDTYEEYEIYMKNIFGKEPNELVYNKIICESFLLNKTQLYKESLQKLDTAIDEYKKYHNNIPIQPLLYKIGTYLKLALPYFFTNLQGTSSGYEYLQHTLDINTKFNQELKNHHLSHYYLSIMYYLCQKYYDAQSELEKTLKIVEECSWRFLYLKGVIEIILANYYDAIKQFTAGLILDQSPDLYLGRSISFLLEGTKRKNNQDHSSFNLRKKSIRMKNSNISNHQQHEQKIEETNHEVFIENSFEDLQKFIQLQTDQQKISLWVTKLLFYNEAYDEAGRALQKVQKKCSQMLELEFWIKFYEGQFEECGQLGNLIMDAFEGKIISEEEEQNSILTLSKPEVVETLKFSKLDISYEKWIIILHLFKREKYSLLTKLLQKLIFDAKNFQEQIELKYNLGVIYLIQGQKTKAFNFFQNLLLDVQNNQKLKIKIKKIVEYKFEQDECLQDLTQELCVNGNHRLSEYLPYKSIEINHKNVKRIYCKPSIPFPLFPKPNIEIKATRQFLQNQLQMQLVEKRIQAPWIKKNKQKIQFTEQIVDAYTDFLKQTKQLKDSIGSTQNLKLSQNQQLKIHQNKSQN